MHGSRRLGMLLLITTVMCGCSHRVKHRGVGQCGACQSQRGLLDIAGDRLKSYLDPQPAHCGCQSGYPPYAAPSSYPGDWCCGPGMSNHSAPCTDCGQLMHSYPQHTAMVPNMPGCTSCGSAPAMLGTPIQPTPSAAPSPAAPAPTPAPPAEGSGNASSAAAVPPASFWKPAVNQTMSPPIHDARRLAPTQTIRR